MRYKYRINCWTDARMRSLHSRILTILMRARKKKGRRKNLHIKGAIVYFGKLGTLGGSFLRKIIKTREYREHFLWYSGTPSRRAGGYEAIIPFRKLSKLLGRVKLEPCEIHEIFYPNWIAQQEIQYRERIWPLSAYIINMGGSSWKNVDVRKAGILMGDRGILLEAES